MDFFYKCRNQPCGWYEIVRTVTFKEISLDMFDEPNPMCVCGHYLIKVGEK